MASRLALLSSRRSRTSDEKLVRLAAVMGIETAVYQVESTASAVQMASVLQDSRRASAGGPR